MQANRHHKNRWYSAVTLFIVVFLLPISSRAQIVINEGSNKNYPTLLDEEGDYEDWIELYNAGNTPVDLYNYSLSDQNNPGQWRFPHHVLQPNEFLIVFCSGKDRYSSAPFTHVVSDSGFVPQLGWNVHSFSNPFFWDGVSNVVINICTYNDFYTVNAVHLQTATNFNSSLFSVVDGTSACGFVTGGNAQKRPNLRLNGATIGTGNLQNSPTDYPAPYGNWYWSTRQQFLIQASELTAAGLAAGNIDSLSFDIVYTNGIGYAQFDVSMSNTGVNSLTNQFAPLSGFFNHTNFKISSTGEQIQLYDPANGLVSALDVNCGAGFPVSVGLFPDASSTIKKFGEPTPGASNNQSLASDDYAQAPVFSSMSGIYTSPISVTITDPNSPSASIYYTLDGSDPDQNATLWNGTPIFIFQSSILRARAYMNGFLPSTTTAASYLFNVNHLTPIISVVTDPDNLYGNSGMFDNPSLDLLKPASIDYFDSTASHNLMHTGRAGIVMDGGWAARSQPQRAFRIKFDHGVLGEGPIMGNIIPDRPTRTQYSDFYLRNGSNNFLRLPYKDAAQCKMMADGTYNYYAAWRPASVYINGIYWGLYEVREKTDVEMFELSENANPSSVEILSSTSQYGFTLRAIEGSVQSFYDSYNNYLQVNTADTSFWNLADQFFDLQNYNDYIISEIWMDNVDWGFNYNNIKLYRSDASNFRWRYILMDLEYGLLPNDQPSIVNCYHDLLTNLIQADPNNPHLNIWLRGIQNDRFRNYFINRFADQMNTVYHPSRLTAVNSSMFNQTVVEMANEFQRWGDPNNIPGQLNWFYQNHLTFQDELLCRPTQMRSHLQSGFGLPQQVTTTLDVFPANSGTIQISTVSPDNYPWTGIYFDGVPIQITATAQPGYQFSHWESNGLITDTLNPVFLDTITSANIDFKAHFISTLSLNEMANQGFDLFPNPTTGITTLRTSVDIETIEHLEISDVVGKRVAISFEKAGEHTYKIDMTPFQSGYYLVLGFTKTGTILKSGMIKN